MKYENLIQRSDRKFKRLTGVTPVLFHEILQVTTEAESRKVKSGRPHPQRVVTGGAITLDHPAAKIHVGLPITADLHTLPVIGQIDNAYGRGRRKNVNEIWLDVLASSGIWAGPHEDALVESKQRSTEAPGSPPRLKTGEVQLTLKPDWNEYGQILVRQRDPLPLTIVSLTVGVATA